MTPLGYELRWRFLLGCLVGMSIGGLGVNSASLVEATIKAAFAGYLVVGLARLVWYRHKRRRERWE